MAISGSASGSVSATSASAPAASPPRSIAVRDPDVHINSNGESPEPSCPQYSTPATMPDACCEVSEHTNSVSFACTATAAPAARALPGFTLRHGFRSRAVTDSRSTRLRPLPRAAEDGGDRHVADGSAPLDEPFQCRAPLLPLRNSSGCPLGPPPRLVESDHAFGGLLERRDTRAVARPSLPWATALAFSSALSRASASVTMGYRPKPRLHGLPLMRSL